MTTSSIALFLLLSSIGQHRCAHSLQPVRLRRQQSSSSGLPARSQEDRSLEPVDDDFCSRSSSSGLIEPYIIGDVPCLSVSDCKWKYEMLVMQHLMSGYFYTDETNDAYDLNGVKGCFLMDGNIYFGGGGTVKEMSGYIYPQPAQRVSCDEKKLSVDGYWLSSFSMDMSILMHMSMPERITYERNMMDTATSMSMMSIPSLATSQYKEETTSTPPTTDATIACEIGMDADITKSCSDGEYCSLDMGVCNTMMTVYEGHCLTIPTICTLDYNPVCGCDENTYANECNSHSSGISVSRVGECEVGSDTTTTVDPDSNDVIDDIVDGVGNVTDAVTEVVSDYVENATVPMLGNLTNDGGDAPSSMSTSSGGGMGTHATGRTTGLFVGIASMVVYGGGWSW